MMSATSARAPLMPRFLRWNSSRGRAARENRTRNPKTDKRTQKKHSSRLWGKASFKYLHDTDDSQIDASRTGFVQCSGRCTDVGRAGIGGGRECSLPLLVSLVISLHHRRTRRGFEIGERG